MWHHPRQQVCDVVVGSRVSERFTDLDDRELVSRVEAAYAAACQTPISSDGGFWLNEFATLKQAEHESLLAGTAGPMLRDPARSHLFHGFDGLTLGSEPDDKLSAAATYDGLLQLAAATGAGHLHYPEAGEANPLPDVETTLRHLDAALGIRVTFPNPFPYESGLATSRGIATFRSAQSLYQAWRIARLVAAKAGPRIVEIGPGLGRTAYYAYQMGLRDYTLVDIPLSGAAQGYFLGRVLGASQVRLHGETGAAPVTIVPPSVFLDGNDRADLVVNVDSLTEMSRSVADAYWRRIHTGTSAFLSINHEHNAFTFRDLLNAAGHAGQASRTPYWLRRGYVEELVHFD